MKYIFLLPIVILMLSTSCANRKNMVYFDGNDGIIASDSNDFSLKYQEDDFLYIQVSGVPEELSKIYNPDRSLVRSSNSGNYRTDQAGLTGYLVDSEGYIDFPVIGKVKVAGKTKNELKESLQEKLKDHLENPILNIQLRNFKITVLGDVQNPGAFTISDERISIVEAIGIAGDLNITAKRTNILLIREKDGKKMKYRFDLTEDDVFNFPAYYLQQNDIIYVEPNRTRMNESKYSPVYSIFISVTSLIITTIVLITNN